MRTDLGSRNGSGCQPDMISGRILRDLADEIAPVFTIIFQSTQDVPDDLNAANKTPIFKMRFKASNSDQLSTSIAVYTADDRCVL